MVSLRLSEKTAADAVVQRVAQYFSRCSPGRLSETRFP